MLHRNKNDYDARRAAMLSDDALDLVIAFRGYAGDVSRAYKGTDTDADVLRRVRAGQEPLPKRDHPCLPTYQAERIRRVKARCGLL